MAVPSLEPSYSETAVDSLFRRALAGRLTPEVRRELAKLGIDLDQPSRAAYPQAVWEGGVKVVAESLFGDLPREKAYFELGRLYIAGFEATLLGKAVVQMGRLIGPERTLRRMQRNQRTTNNYTVVEIEKYGETHFCIHSRVDPAMLPGMKDVFGSHIGDLLSGVYCAVLEMLNLKNPKVTYRTQDAATYRYDFDVRWDP